MELENILKSLGLSEKEAKVYLVLLQLGTASVPSIAEKAGVKRPTAYLILDEIRKKGMATLLPRKDKVVYSAESPEKLLADQKRKEEMVKAKMPELLAIYNTKKEKPKVKYYQGEKEVRELYGRIFREKEVDMYGSIGAIEKALPDIIALSKEMIKKHGTKIREILQADENSIKYSKQKFPDYHKVKIIDKKVSLPTDNIIFGNKLAIFSYKDEPSAVVIEDGDVVITYRTMFEIVWEAIK